MSNDTTLYCVYRIVCFANGLSYIGQTKHPKARKATHFNHLKKNKHYNRQLQNTYNKYGKQSFYFEILESGISKLDVDNREIYWIAIEQSSHELCNATKGGNTGMAGWNKKRIIWNGVEYQSYVEAEEKTSISKDTLRKYINSGYNCDDDVPNPAIYKPTVWEGVEYSSISEAARACGVAHNTIRSWLEKGYTCSDDIPEFNSGSSKTRVWNGIEYPSAVEAAKANGVTTYTMYHWLYEGYTSDYDVEKNKPIGRRKLITWNGLTYIGIKEAAQANNVSYGAMKYRLKAGYKSDLDVIEASKLQGRKPASITWNGIIFNSVSEAKKVYGVYAHQIQAHNRNGYFCDADLHHKRVPVVINGIEYRSILSAAKANGVSSDTIKKWINRV